MKLDVWSIKPPLSLPPLQINTNIHHCLVSSTLTFWKPEFTKKCPRVLRKRQMQNAYWCKNSRIQMHNSCSKGGWEGGLNTSASFSIIKIILQKKKLFHRLINFVKVICLFTSIRKKLHTFMENKKFKSVLRRLTSKTH